MVLPSFFLQIFQTLWKLETETRVRRTRDPLSKTSGFRCAESMRMDAVFFYLYVNLEENFSNRLTKCQLTIFEN